MRKYVYEFFKRGLIFGGFGPIVLGIILYIIALNLNITFSGKVVLLGISSTYLLAFIHAGSSVFNQIEEWSISKSIAFHLGTLYLAYLSCYLVNSWIPFDWIVVFVFTLSFLIIYFIIWIIVFIIVKGTARKLNNKLM